MNTHTEKSQENKSQSVSNAIFGKSNNAATFQFVDNRNETVAQRKLQQIADDSPQARQSAQLLAMAGPKNVQLKKEEEELVQKKENNTGLPDNLKSGIENLSGYSMDDVKVHRNSDKPAQLNAHAYAQGTDIHLASGQEKHLPHEAWHVVQQKQGRVHPSLQMKGKVNINDDAGLEKEADIMGAKALVSHQNKALENNIIIQPQSIHVIQRMLWTLDGNTWRDDDWKPAPPGGPVGLPKSHPEARAWKNFDSWDDTPIPVAVPQPAVLATALRYVAPVNITTAQGTQVYLDNDQLKHQPPAYPIGTRVTSGDSTFKASIPPDANWHIGKTLVCMGAWADSLVIPANDNAQHYYGQAKEEDGISYEAFCIQWQGTKYVFFHCYPARGNAGDKWRQ